MRDNHKGLTEEIVNAVTSGRDFVSFRPISGFKSERRNQLILFMKPELFVRTGQPYIKHSIELVLSKLEEFNAVTDCVALVGGQNIRGTRDNE